MLDILNSPKFVYNIKNKPGEIIRIPSTGNSY